MSALEARYRRLLRLFPAEHQAVYKDEMLGVLMATASPGQRTPHSRDVLDLFRGATRVRLSRLLRGEAWGDAASIVSLVAPIALCLGLATYFLVGSMLFVLWPVCAAAGLAGMRRVAAGTAWLGFLFAAIWAIASGGNLLPELLAWLALAGLGAAALTWSDGPRRGLELLGQGRFIAVSAGVAVLGLVELNQFNFGMRYLGEERFEGGWAAMQTWLLLAVGIVLVAAVFRFTTAAHRRAGALLALPLATIVWASYQDMPGLAGLQTLVDYEGPAGVVLWIVIPIVVATGVMVPLALSARAQARSSDALHSLTAS